MRRFAGWNHRWFLLLWAWVFLPVPGVAGADASKPAAGEEDPSLAQVIQDYEQGEQLLAEERAKLKQSRTTQEKRRLEGNIQELERRQADRVKILEKWMGPLPPIVTPEVQVPLDRQIRSQEQRHETVLETDVERRRP